MSMLITGATGKIGRLLIDDLLQRDITLRALSRDSSASALPKTVPVLQGSLASAPPAAFDDVDTAFVFPADGVETFIERATAAGVTRFVVLSSLAVSGRNARDTASASAAHHRATEQAVTSRTDAWTILRPGNFANNLLSWAWPIRAGRPVRIPYPTSSQVLIHEADIAAAAAITLSEPGHERHIYELTGPESLTKIEQLAAISAAIGREIPFEEVEPDEFRGDVQQFIPGDIIDMLLQYWLETVEEPEQPLPAPLGLARTPLSQWAQDHRTDFTA
jgi:uncharacterized protein YbjT (DUF2867 family)